MLREVMKTAPQTLRQPTKVPITPYDKIVDGRLQQLPRDVPPQKFSGSSDTPSRHRSQGLDHGVASSSLTPRGVLARLMLEFTHRHVSIIALDSRSVPSKEGSESYASGEPALIESLDTGSHQPPRTILESAISAISSFSLEGTSAQQM